MYEVVSTWILLEIINYGCVRAKFVIIIIRSIAKLQKKIYKQTIIIMIYCQLIVDYFQHP